MSKPENLPRYTTARVLRWLVLNGALAACVWHWFANGSDWAGNVVKFMVWWTLALSMLGAIVAASKSSSVSDIAPGRRKVPASIGLVYDFGVCVVLAAFAHFVLAAAFAVATFFQVAMHEGIEKKLAERERGE